MTPLQEARLAWIKTAVASDTDDCIVWPWPVAATGYGQLRLEGRTQSAHRVTCRMAHGEPGNGLWYACHSCGDQACCNPRHLRWATPSENEADKVAHGTSNHGERNHTAKLTEKDVIKIRAMRREGHTFSELARSFGVTPATVSTAARGITWSHVAM